MAPWTERCVRASACARRYCRRRPRGRALLGPQASGSGTGARAHGELLPEERQRLVERSPGRRALLVLQVFGQHGVRLGRVPVGIARRRVDLHRDEGVAELPTKRLEALLEAEGIVRETQAEKASARRGALLHAGEIAIGDADVGLELLGQWERE